MSMRLTHAQVRSAALTAYRVSVCIYLCACIGCIGRWWVWMCDSRFVCCGFAQLCVWRGCVRGCMGSSEPKLTTGANFHRCQCVRATYACACGIGYVLEKGSFLCWRKRPRGSQRRHPSHAQKSVACSTNATSLPACGLNWSLTQPRRALLRDFAMFEMVKGYACVCEREGAGKGRV